MGGFLLAVLIVGGLWIFFTMRSNYKAEIAQTAASSANDWFAERGIDSESVRFSTYSDPALTRRQDGYVVVGVGKKGTGEDVGFVAEVVPGRETTGIELMPPGMASHHQRCAIEAKKRGVSLAEIMANIAPPGGKKATDSAKYRSGLAEYKARVERNFVRVYEFEPREDHNTACTKAFTDGIERAWNNELSQEEGTLYAATVYYTSLTRYSLYSQARRVLEGMNKHIEQAAASGEITSAHIDKTAQRIMEAQHAAGITQAVERDAGGRTRNSDT